MSDIPYLLWLSRVDGLGPKKRIELIRFFGSAREVFDAPFETLREAPFLSARNISGIAERRDRQTADDYAEKLESAGIGFVSYFDPAYPPLLKEIHDPPSGLYVLGELPGADTPMVSVIGSRRCSEYGLTAARKISKGLAENGVAVVSGMAKGIDGMAHRGALDGGGKTVAVLGCGVDVCYPAENRALRDAIIQSGCVISEYPPGTTPAPGHFPARNRIISGLSAAVVVVEAAKRSGTLITVNEALEQGRDVMAVPGNVTSRLSEGTNALIKDGAGVATCHEDVLEFLGIEKKREKGGGAAAEAARNLAPEERIIYDALKDGPVTFDEIVAKSNSQAQTVSYVLLMLELKGLARKLPGRRFERA